ncbi:hypothetical protein [Lacticaseibacillus hulanensis]|uniref:hypothetical protein n=1 Tax=Lacticaseibacillus hulanensis TaxID=2493111 RepID=UPI000FDB555B|nr:hypothetical protein [Lacticaseibacillus hulanensis]
MRKNETRETKRYGEIVLCLAGGLIGLMVALLEQTANNAVQFEMGDAVPIDGRAFGLMIAAIFAICLPFFMNDNRTVVITALYICGAFAIICGGLPAIISGALIMVGATVGLFRA